MSATQLLFLIPILPLAGAIINGLFGQRLPRGLVGIVACLGPVVAFCFSVHWFFELRAENDPNSYYPNWIGDWISVGSLDVSFGFVLDRLSSIMILVVTGVGSLIHIYSIGYMKKDAGLPRYFAYLNLFMASMLILVLADNLVFMFLGWEGVGLCSYLLIGFWFDEEANARAGKKAFVVNRIGDFGFLLGIFLAFVTFETLNMQQINTDSMAATGIVSSTGQVISDTARFWIPLLLFIGATGKSAQIPLYIWLPDAMAGPTPVSALIHAATMVTSGVYMMARLAPLYNASPAVLMIVAVIGAITALVAGFIAMSQNDIKKVLAYSTVSQLGYMFLAAGLGAYGIAIFHLVTHAFFKGLLFLGAGAVIYSLHHEQDMRRMGGLRKKLPWTFWTMVCGSLAIAGCPLLSGFFSKDAIIEEAMHKSPVLWVVAMVTAVMTSFYIFRLVAMTFLGKSSHEIPETSETGSHGSHHEPIREAPPTMLIPMVILAAFSVFGGLFSSIPGYIDPDFHAEHSYIGLFIGVGLFCAGLFLAWFYFVGAPERRARITRANTLGGGLWRVSHGKLFVDEIYQIIIVKPLELLSQALEILVDRLLIDGLLVRGSGFMAKQIGGVLRQMQTGRVPTYAGWLVGGVMILLFLIIIVMKSDP